MQDLSFILVILPCYGFAATSSLRAQLHEHTAAQVWTLPRVCHSLLWTTSLSPSWMPLCQWKEQIKHWPMLALRWG